MIFAISLQNQNCKGLANIFKLIMRNPVMWKESETTELKESLAIRDILETACAFANSKGGTIYVGISDKGKVTGISVGKGTLENLANEMRRGIDPQINGIGIEVIQLDSKDVIRISVPESQTKPHLHRNRAYQRIGKTNQPVSASELEAIYLRKIMGMHGLNGKVIEEAALGDIDDNSLERYVKEAGLAYNGKRHALKSLNLIRNEKILAAAILFFGRSPEKFFPLYGIKCAVMAANDIIEMADFRENIYTAVDTSLSFVLRNIPSSSRIEGTRRVEIPRIPNDVLREALVNAMIHRDYSIGSSIFVRITPDSVKISNPGVLPPTLSINDLYTEHHSEPRNRMLAELAHKIKLIEHWGTGTTKILNGLRAQGLEDPVFSEKKGYFELMLPLHEPTLNERQKTIIILLKNKEMSFSTIARNIGASERTVRSDIYKLEKTGFIKKIRRGREVHYLL